MPTTDYREYLSQFTLEKYETEFADRHLVHGAIEKFAREKPGHSAFVVYDTGREVSYREFDEVSTAWALKLLEMGFGPGDFLATSLPLTAEHIFLEYACFKIGVIHAPLDLRLKAPEVVRSLDLIEAKGFAFLGQTAIADFGLLGAAVQAECPYVEHFIHFTTPAETIDGALSIETFAADAERLAADSTAPIHSRFQQVHDAVQPTQGTQVIYTTGSTGLPKPALLSHRNITSQNMCLAAGFDMFQTERMLVHLPPSHVGCQAEQLITTFFTGQTAVVMHMFDAEKTLDCVAKHKVDCFGQVPSMFSMQWKLPNYDDYDLSSVKKVMYGGQTVSKQYVRQLLDQYPTAGTGLGLTEMAGFVTYSGMIDDVDLLATGVGWSMPITPLTIRQPMRPDGTAGEELPDGETGEICFSGPQIFIEYVNNPEAYRKTVTTDGICYTGDLGYKSEQGLIFAGRSKLVIKPKGYQVHPGQIESHFADLKDHVAACGAVGAYHDVFSEGVVLFVETKDGTELTRELLDSHAKGIAGYMRPLHYIFLEQGAFPLNRVNKTDYVKLQKLATAEVEQLRANGGWDKA